MVFVLQGPQTQLSGMRKRGRLLDSIGFTRGSNLLAYLLISFKIFNSSLRYFSNAEQICSEILLEGSNDFFNDNALFNVGVI